MKNVRMDKRPRIYTRSRYQQRHISQNQSLKKSRYRLCVYADCWLCRFVFLRSRTVENDEWIIYTKIDHSPPFTRCWVIWAESHACVCRFLNKFFCCSPLFSPNRFGWSSFLVLLSRQEYIFFNNWFTIWRWISYLLRNATIVLGEVRQSGWWPKGAHFLELSSILVIFAWIIELTFEAIESLQ